MYDMVFRYVVWNGDGMNRERDRAKSEKKMLTYWSENNTKAHDITHALEIDGFICFIYSIQVPFLLYSNVISFFYSLDSNYAVQKSLQVLHIHTLNDCYFHSHRCQYAAWMPWFKNWVNFLLFFLLLLCCVNLSSSLYRIHRPLYSVNSWLLLLVFEYNEFISIEMFVYHVNKPIIISVFFFVIKSSDDIIIIQIKAIQELLLLCYYSQFTIFKVLHTHNCYYSIIINIKKWQQILCSIDIT